MTAETRLTVPTMLTLARIAAAPAVAGAILWSAFYPGAFAPALWTAFVLFALASLTDWLDGFLARKLDQRSTLGAALDHSADKALVTAALVALAGTGLKLDLVAAAALILTRDVAVAGLREGLSLSGRSLPVMRLGKIKTAAEMIGVGGAILMRLLLAPWVEQAARAGLWIGAALALWSGAIYFAAAFRKS